VKEDVAVAMAFTPPWPFPSRGGKFRKNKISHMRSK